MSAHDSQDRFAQIGLLDRLNEVAGDAQLLATNRILRLPSRREHDQNTIIQPRVLPNALRDFEAIHIRHHHVQERQSNRHAANHGVVQLNQPGRSVGRQNWLHAPIGEYILEDAPVRAIVIDHQHRHVGQTFESQPRVRRRICGDAEANREMELAPLADLALDPELPAHELHQLHRDGESQPSATVTPRRGAIGLAERFKDLLLLLGWNPNAGVRDDKVQIDVRLLLRIDGHGDDDLSLLGEFQRIAH